MPSMGFGILAIALWVFTTISTGFVCYVALQQEVLRILSLQTQGKLGECVGEMAQEFRALVALIGDLGFDSQHVYGGS